MSLNLTWIFTIPVFSPNPTAEQAAEANFNPFVESFLWLH